MKNITFLVYAQKIKLGPFNLFTTTLHNKAAVRQGTDNLKDHQQALLM